MHIISGSLKNHPIIAPKGSHTRPTSGRLRGTLFNICQNDIENANFLDLFAGSGAMGLEALSRGATKSTFVDNDIHSIRCIHANLKSMELADQAIVVKENVFSWLDKMAKKSPLYTIIYADPPYDALMKEGNSTITFSERLLQQIDAGALLAAGGLFFIEDSVGFKANLQKLTTLKLVSERHSGRSKLLQFQRLDQVFIKKLDFRGLEELPQSNLFNENPCSKQRELSNESIIDKLSSP